MGHYYTKEGKPMHRVKKIKDDGYTNTTIVHARKYSLFGSVNEIISKLSKSQLNDWKITQYLNHVDKWYIAHRNAFIMGLYKEEDMIKDVKKATDKTLAEAPNLGTSLHKMLEGSRDIEDDFEAIVYNAVNSYHKQRGITILHKESTLVPDYHGIAGQIDLVFETDVIEIEDYKTMKTLDAKGNRKKIKPYESHLIQVSAYASALAIEMELDYVPQPTLLYLSVDEPGYIFPYGLSTDEVTRNFRIFKNLYNIWMDLYQYYPCERFTND